MAVDNENNQKIENLLNLALDVNEQAREKSISLSDGYNEETKTWELIVKYNGDLSRFADELVKIELLIAGYAIVTLPENLIESFVNLEEVEYVEKPKRLFFSSSTGRSTSCINSVTDREPGLTGNGIMLAVLDSGIDYSSMEFRKKSGDTRISWLWDQTLTPERVNAMVPESASEYQSMAISPVGFDSGVEFDSNRINKALSLKKEGETYQLVPSRDTSGHGTAVTAVAAGSGNIENGKYRGVATDVELIIVKLGNALPSSFPKTTQLMRALTYVVKKATDAGKPLAINLSFGNNYGSHDGSSLLERFLDNIAEYGRNVIAVGSGNEGASSIHTSGVLQQSKTKTIELSIASFQSGISVQIWKEFNDRFQLNLISPAGERVPINVYQSGTQSLKRLNTEILIYIGEPSPYSSKQEYYFDFIPVNSFIDSGIWSFEMVSENIVVGNYDYYLPANNVLMSGTSFYDPTPGKTLTIPSTTVKVITVGAYDTVYNAYADFSGRGYVLTSDKGSANHGFQMGPVKPDIAAPGVNISTIYPGNVQTVVSGTSFATPFVAGAAALLMEWGIVKKNDPYLYGEKVKAYLIKGAKQLPGMESPNPMTGDCVKLVLG